jgi:undecaprenyl-phosphate 4-deoxy-4-formamido-L-arabinose transferase
MPSVAPQQRESDLSEVNLYSFVIPVFNGEATIEGVVARILRAFNGEPIQIVLVDDGSHDSSARVCRELALNHREHVEFVELARNFGEHSAVLAGLAQSKGTMVAVLDDDGQNPPEELPGMFATLIQTGADVVYGKYMERKHHWFRVAGSRFNDAVANVMLNKPKGLYLSSFKVMNRFIVNEIVKHRGPFPYIDGLICRTTRRLVQVEVSHDSRTSGKSNYNLRRLIRLWLNMFLGFSILPLRLTSLIGMIIAALSCIWLLIILVDKLWLSPNVTAGIPTVLAVIVLFSGFQLVALGMIGEYLGRVFLENNGQPQYVIRAIHKKENSL